MLAIVPPGATICSHSSNVAGTPTASMAVSTPRSPVSFITALAAFPSLLSMAAVAPKLFADLETMGVEIDHDDLGEIELSGEQCREADRSCADDCQRASRLDLAIEHAALERRREDVDSSMTIASSSAPAGIG